MAIGVVVALCCGGGVVGAGHQAGPRRVFSRAIAAIFPTQHEQTSMQTRFSPRCSRPTSAEAELIIDVN